MKKETELIIQVWSQTSNEIIYWNQMANQQIFEISKQLLGAGIIAIPLIGTFVATVSKLFNGASYLIEFSLILILLSIILGIQQLESSAKFYNKYALYNSNRAQALLDNRNKTLTVALKKANEANQSKPNSTGSGTLLILQSFSLGIGLLIIGTVIIIISSMK